LAAAAEADEAEAEAAAAADEAAAVLGADVGVLAALDVVPLVEDDVGDGVAAGTVDTPLTDTAGFAATVALAEELVVDVLVVLVLFAILIVWLAEDEMVPVVVVTFVELPDDPFTPPCEPLLPALPLVTPMDLSNEKVHFFTSCTSDIPLTITGVKVILHVCVAGPIEVFICVTVVTVVGSETALSTFGR